MKVLQFFASLAFPNFNLIFESWIMDGLYLVTNPGTNKIETAFCNFGSSIRDILNNLNWLIWYLFIYILIHQFQITLFGNVEDKTKSAH